MLKLSKKQRQILDKLVDQKTGIFSTTEAIAWLDITGNKFCSAKTISVINAIQKKLDCGCCHIHRVGRLGRSNVGQYDFKILPHALDERVSKKRSGGL